MFKNWISILAIALTHFILWFILCSISVRASMTNFDSDLPPTLHDTMFNTLYSIVSFPIGTILFFFPLAGRMFGGFLGWIPFIANSLLWGFGLRWLIGKYLKSRKD